MATPAEHQQPTAPPPKEEGPRSFAVFLRKLGQGEAESSLSYELHELGKRLQEEAHARNEKVKGTLTLSLAFEAEPEEELVKVAYDVKAKPPKPRRAKGYFWLTKGGNLSTEQPKDTKQAAFPFRDVANDKGVPHDLPIDDDFEPREA
jgi:hypothetical protein